MRVARLLIVMGLAMIQMSDAKSDGFQEIPRRQPIQEAPIYNNDNDYVEDNYVQDSPSYQFQAPQGLYGNGYPVPAPSAPLSKDEWIYEQAYNATGGACNLKQNPHSYVCNKWNFDGNQVFPLHRIDWRGVLQGDWYTVTYVNPYSENEGREFYMAKNPHRPTQPMGVFNRYGNAPVGAMWIRGKEMSFENWRGYNLRSARRSYRQVDAYTVQVIMVEKKVEHLFTCRDFNRNNNHHLLCAWDIRTRGYGGGGRWEHHGFFGFLTVQVWQGFLSRTRH